jgi:hypothetical protein
VTAAVSVCNCETSPATVTLVLTSPTSIRTSRRSLSCACKNDVLTHELLEA